MSHQLKCPIISVSQTPSDLLIKCLPMTLNCIINYYDKFFRMFHLSRFCWYLKNKYLIVTNTLASCCDFNYLVNWSPTSIYSTSKQHR